MSISQTNSSAGQQSVHLDVLIIGGGVVGLWLLNDLRRAGYSALLLEKKELGGEQTCHSHGYLHQGYLYTNEALASQLRGVTAMWSSWLGERQPLYRADRSYFGFPNPADASQRARLWRSLSLPYATAPSNSWPLAIRGGAIRTVLETPERAIDLQWLVSELSGNTRDAISRIEEVARVQVDFTTRRVVEIEAVMAGTGRLRFRPAALVLAAGHGNAGLLDLASAGSPAFATCVAGQHQVRKAHMLIVQGDSAELSPVTGVFSIGGLFMVSRVREGTSVWMISDDRSPEMTVAEDWVNYDARWWLARVWASLRQIAPDTFGRPDRFKWGIYEGPKAEGRAGGLIPHEERIEQFGLSNLWTIWPTKLTLAPQASAEVIKQIQQLVPFPSSAASGLQAWDAARAFPGVAPERWVNTPLVSWDDFRMPYDMSWSSHPLRLASTEDLG